MLITSAGRQAKSYKSCLALFEKKNAIARIMQRDAKVYTSSRPLHALIMNRLGWVNVAARMQREIPLLEAVRDECIQGGFIDVVLLGMGGSSLCPETQSRLFPMRKPFRTLHVLDSTDPSALLRVFKSIDLPRTLFIVASKSGGTLETRSQADFFAQQLQQANIRNWGAQFIAITDEGSALEQAARAAKYRRVFLNPSDIGGRFSSLSYFGLVPALFLQLDLRRWLSRAVEMQEVIATREDEANPANALAALLVAGYFGKQEKLTFIASKKTEAIVPWIEQLVAESTGKKGIGIVPVEAEPIGNASDYGNDRLLMFMRDKRESAHGKSLQQGVNRRKLAWGEVVLSDSYDVAAQFLLWEAAIALAGFAMQINPFDEPNVAESKANTQALLTEYEKSGSLPWRSDDASAKSVVLSATEKQIAAMPVPDALRALVSGAKSPTYFSILSYADQTASYKRELAKLRAAIRKKSGCAVLAGTGPRFLHSIGQLYKGGSQIGRFLVIMRNEYGKLEIPGKRFDFGTLISAQAIGDSRALMKRKRPVLVIATATPELLLKELTKAVLSSASSATTRMKSGTKKKIAKSSAKTSAPKRTTKKSTTKKKR